MSLRTTIRHEAEDAVDRVQTLLPARVVRVVGGLGLVDVDILVADEDGRSLGRVFRCPVASPRWGVFAIVAPLAVGDKVWVACASYSLEEFMETARLGTPEDPRRHHLTDAVVWPALSVPGDAGPVPESDRLQIWGPATGVRIELTDAGKVAIRTPSDELLGLLNDLLTMLGAALCAAPGAPLTWAPPHNPVTLATRLAAFKE